MQNFVPRTDRTEHDDWVLYVEPRLDKWNEALPIYAVDDPTKLMGWKIQPRYT